MPARARNPGLIGSMAPCIPPASVDHLLDLQDGLIRRDQAISAGMTRDQIGNELRRRRWVRVLPRVYAVGVDPRASRTRIRAAWLWAGPDSVLAGAAAAWWHGLRASAPMIVEVIVPLGRRMTPQRGVRLIRSNVPPAEIVTVDWIRVTSVPRTCLDLARWKRDDRLEEAIRLGRLTAAELPPSLDKSRYRRGQVGARRAAAEVTAGPWSKPERIAHRLLADAGISGWVANERAKSVDRTGVPGHRVRGSETGDRDRRSGVSRSRPQSAGLRRRPRTRSGPRPGRLDRAQSDAATAPRSSRRVRRSRPGIDR